jgi:hypothetical protein
MRFTLDVDLDGMPADQVEKELGRILRYWAGGLKGYELGPGATEAIFDSDYTPVGRWMITDAPGTDPLATDAPATAARSTDGGRPPHEPTGDELEQLEREEPQQPS